MAGRVKRYFLRGLAVLVPTLVTIWIIAGGFLFFHANIGGYIKRGLKELIILVGGSEPELAKPWIDIALSVAGFLVTLVIVCIVGVLLASVVGRAVWRRIEKLITSVPLLRRVYPYVKQITDFVLTEDHEKLFSRVVAVEWPRKGIWSIAFVTGSGLKKVVDKVQKEFLTLLIPNSPTPVTGYVIIVPKEDTIPLDMTVEEAFRFAISAGVVTPRGEQPAGSLKADPESKGKRRSLWRSRTSTE